MGTVVRIAFLPLAMAWLSLSPRAHAVTANEVDGKIAELVHHIKGAQRNDGSWFYQRNIQGFTALNILALSTAGVPETDPTITAGISYLKEHFPSRSAYGVGLYACAFAAVNPVTYREEIERAAEWLIKRQKGGTWNYTGRGRGDNSVTQFAMLGIKAAIDSGVDVPKEVLRATENHFRVSQNGDGGWNYARGGQGNTQPTMIPAGLSSLHICGVPFERSMELEKGPAFLGVYEQDRAIAKGLKALSQHLRFNQPYLSYGIERVGIFFDRQTIAGVDWYQRGCEAIVRNRTNAGHLEVPAQFNLLFLAKGDRPLLISKIDWGGSAHQRWNHRHYDARNMVAYLSAQFQQPLDWQTRPLTAREDLARTPLLYISGHDKFALDEAQKEGLHRFVENGGTVLIAPNLQDRRFIQSCIATLREIYPGCRFEKLPDYHQLRGMYFDLFNRDLSVRVWRSGCSSKRIFIFEDDFSLAFERPGTDELSRQLAANFARFALKEKPLVRRLDKAVARKVEHESGPEFRSVGGVRKGALTIAQLRYEGDDDADAMALDNFLGFLRQGLNMPTAKNRVLLDPGRDPLHQYPVLYITGHDQLPLSGLAKTRLRDYLRRGGFLVSDARCSSETYDRAFRFLVKELFPELELERIPLNSPVYHEPFELKPMPNPTLKRLMADEEAYLWGVRHNDRYVVIYSQWDFGCSMDNHLEDDIPGYEAPFSYQLLANIVSYALSY